MKKYLVYLMVLVSQNIFSQNLNEVYRYKNQTLELYDDKFKLSTHLTEDSTDVANSITWFEGIVAFHNDSAICTDSYYQTKLYFERKNDLCLELLSIKHLLDKYKISNVRILEGKSYFFGNYLREKDLFFISNKFTTNNLYIFDWENGIIKWIYDVHEAKYITNNLDSLLNILNLSK